MVAFGQAAAFGIGQQVVMVPGGNRQFEQGLQQAMDMGGGE
jgi:hypothetical protein